MSWPRRKLPHARQFRFGPGLAARDTRAAGGKRLELGRYRLDEQVGQGGMAVVWRGWDTQLRRIVAVKVLHAHLHSREEIRRRFDREAHAVARLHHPHILDVYDFSGPTAQPSYLVTEFIAGHTLRAFAEAHPFDPPELAAAALLPIAEALEHAHDAGVVHRDLKPENIMVRDDGIVKLTDFGIAALLDPDEKFTVTGSILGSPSHLAPETIEGRAADPRSDLFSFGTILYWLSCGKLPYSGASPAALLRSILEGKRQDPRMIRPSISDAQARIINRCLENDPQKRYQTAGQLKSELGALLKDAGLEHPLEEVRQFVLAPEAQAAEVRKRLVQRSLEQGEALIAQHKTSAALQALGRALALDPQNEQARGRVEKIRRRERLWRLLRRAAAAVLTSLLLLLCAWQARAAIQRARVAAHEREAAAATQRMREEAARTAEAATRPPVEPPQPQEPSRELPKKKLPAPAPVAVAHAPSAKAVRLHARYGAQLQVDGKDEGNSNMFDLKLAPGLHKILVHHPCCSDALQDLVVIPSRDLYQLNYGPPQPARFRVLNAPSGAQLLVDGVVAGTAADPRPWSMTQPAQQVTVTIGNRTLVTTLKAGMDNALDFAQAAP